MTYKIAPSILSADFANLQDAVEALTKLQVPYLHIDIMDGHFVDNLTFGVDVVSALRPHTNMVFDCHMMVENPENYIEGLKKAGADIMSVHVESTKHIHGVLQKIKQADMKASIVLNPGTPLIQIEPVLELVDQVLIMTVNPGFGGQSFIPEMTAKVAALNAIRRDKGLNFDIEVDGGINPETIKLVKKAGADVFVAGSYIFNGVVSQQLQYLEEALDD